MRDAAGFLEDAASCKVFWETAVLPPRPAPDADLMVSGASSVTRARLSGAGAVAPWGSFYTGSTDRAGEHFLVYTWWLLPDTKPLLSRGSLALPPPHLGLIWASPQPTPSPRPFAPAPALTPPWLAQTAPLTSSSRAHDTLAWSTHLPRLCFYLPLFASSKQDQSLLFLRFFTLFSQVLKSPLFM